MIFESDRPHTVLYVQQAAGMPFTEGGEVASNVPGLANGRAPLHSLSPPQGVCWCLSQLYIYSKSSKTQISSNINPLTDSYIGIFVSLTVSIISQSVHPTHTVLQPYPFN